MDAWCLRQTIEEVVLVRDHGECLETGDGLLRLLRMHVVLVEDQVIGLDCSHDDQHPINGRRILLDHFRQLAQS